ncbi:uncharacterized protein RHIMIDRAFT_301542 [Rhizopus microsporus ATCC 52813]|uniref:Reverse transcriptase domain-containing protein n=1 Tax=Rhizopus microsporus ATCC 52813 TaxID=1340429 RepID=A0A2G4SIU0_RHIZD|nr:uncharacterized protein RHIMIDRAFT_301542 [Rhizopus microsporus ATCC 52813]PHZ08669.1 hypothetical protein RHIMIDRAFT_301542 [Rhizopus microsporus ATCC 52813]
MTLHTISNTLSTKVLAYADDLIIFLNDLQGLHEMKRLITVYNNASNAKINFDSTIAFSASGLPPSTRTSALYSYGITRWHDRRSPEPLTYLCYPLILSSAQMAFF